jgi:hypothetical protein
MKALVDVCEQMSQHGVLPEGEFLTILLDCAKKCLKQSIERIARIRETATACTLRMLACQVRVACMQVPCSNPTP